MNTKAYHFGYQGHKSSEELLAAVTERGAVLCDIRLVPYSRWQPAWNKKNLQTTFGESYLHIPQLGNLNYKGGPVAISDMKTGIEIVLELLEQQPVVLMCVCQNFETCHRSYVAAELEERGVGVDALEFAAVGNDADSQQGTLPM